MKYFKYIYSVVAASMVLISCNKDVLDRTPQTTYVNAEFWRNEDDLRLFGNGFYTQYFNGYATGFVVDYTPVRGYTFSDDLTSRNAQTSFESSVPASRGTTSEAEAWLTTYAGPSWNFTWVRKANIFLDRIEKVAKPNISADAYKHWSAVARFFRGYEYSRLVSVFGDVPYFDKELLDTELPLLYKDRDNRGLVMDKVYDDFKYVLANMRNTDGTQYLNRYIAAAFISRFMLFEGTWQQYHGLDAVRAKKYLEFAVEAGDIVMANTAYSFTSDFKSLFASESLASNKEVLMYRTYDAALTITHSIGSYSNGTEVNPQDANLVLAKSFIVNDGNVWQNTPIAAAKTFTIPDMVVTRDPRFEATFIDQPMITSASLLYGYKFASKDAISYYGGAKGPYPAIWGSSTNTNDAPVIRLGEVVLNWIEAKAVLAQYLGGPAVTQADLNRSVNAIRNRPIEPAALTKYPTLTKTAPLQLAALPIDPVRDADVPALIWEIRRERRMEFVYEGFRLLDIKRWNKLNYMNFSTNPDYYLGPWVDLNAPGLLRTTYLTAANATAGTVKVKNAAGTVITWNGSNASSMVGFWMITNAANRNAFTDKSYLSPVGQTQITQYAEKGYKLTQTTGW